MILPICQWCNDPIPVLEPGAHARPCPTLDYASGVTDPDINEIRYCKPTSEMDFIRLKAERDVWSGEACREEQTAGKGPCGGCRYCLPGLLKAERERYEALENRIRALGNANGMQTQIGRWGVTAIRNNFSELFKPES